MYHPYFRGKQNELMTIREMAPFLARAGFCPIIEPVRETLSGLHRALDAVAQAGGRSLVIVNPRHGDLSGAGTALSRLLVEQFPESNNISAGILVDEKTMLDDALGYLNEHGNHRPAFVHAGFPGHKDLAIQLGRMTRDQRHVFVDAKCGKLYQRHFQGAHRVLVRDGFGKKQRNRDYAEMELFSDLHATFREEGMDGFGDFLTVGDEYSESGGPAYAVAIHLTFIDKDQDDAMWIYHFVSDRKDTPTDPAGKFAEALDKLIEAVHQPGSKIRRTAAVEEFEQLHREGHFPGLGYVKKLSMKHHIETLADYCARMA